MSSVSTISHEETDLHSAFPRMTSLLKVSVAVKRKGWCDEQKPQILLAAVYWVQIIQQKPFKEALSVLMLCEPSNCRRPLSDDAKMADLVEYFRILSVFSCKNLHQLRKLCQIMQVARVRSINHNVGVLIELSCRV